MKKQGLKVLHKIYKTPLDEEIPIYEIYQDLVILSSFKYALTTSVDIERSFSIY